MFEWRPGQPIGNDFSSLDFELWEEEPPMENDRVLPEPVNDIDEFNANVNDDEGDLTHAPEVTEEEDDPSISDSFVSTNRMKRLRVAMK